MKIVIKTSATVKREASVKNEVRHVNWGSSHADYQEPGEGKERERERERERREWAKCGHKMYNVLLMVQEVFGLCVQVIEMI